MIDRQMQRFGGWLLLFNRFLPGVRSLVFIAAGASGLPAGKTLGARRVGGRTSHRGDAGGGLGGRGKPGTPRAMDGAVAVGHRRAGRLGRPGVGGALPGRTSAGGTGGVIVGRMRQAGECKRAGAWVLALLLAAGLGGCRCGEGTTPIGGDFTVSPERLDFGAALTGEVVVRPLLLGNDGRSSRTLDLTTAAPFSAAARVELGAGELRTVDITFLAGSDLASGTLQVTDGETVVEVALVGEGVEPLQCVPSAPCRLSRFDSRLAQLRGVGRGGGERLHADEPVPGEGHLRGRRVPGDAAKLRRRQCVHHRRLRRGPRLRPVAPASARRPRRSVTSRPAIPPTGAERLPAPEGTPCGLLGCDLAQLCVFGTCKDFAPAPDGLPCGPASPCRDGRHLPRGHLRDQGAVTAAARVVDYARRRPQRSSARTRAQRLRGGRAMQSTAAARCAPSPVR